MEIINYFKSCFNLFLFKDEAFKYIQKKVKWQEAFWVTFVIVIISSLFDFGMGIYFETDSLSIIELILTIALGIGVMFLFFYIAHLLFRLIGGKANFVDFFKIALSVHLGQTIISILLMVIFGIIFGIVYAINLRDLLVIFGLLVVFLLIGVLVWEIGVAVKYYALTYKISQIKALFIVLIPIILVILFIIISLFIFTALVISDSSIATNATSALV